MRRIFISDIEGKQAFCFDTGLEPRAFARTKMSQSLIESGYIVKPDGTHEVWKASGVNDVDGSMRVWGPVFRGERLELLLNEATALQGVVYWIRAKMLLGETYSTLNPGAAYVLLEDSENHPKGSVFFAPANLANRCLLVEKAGSHPQPQTLRSGRRHSDAIDVPVLDRYSCPDLTGMEASAFCAGVMLYKILTKQHPYPSDATIYQDMREGVFLPPHLAAPELDKKLCKLIHSALMLPVAKKKPKESAADIISGFLNILMGPDNQSVSVSSLFTKLPAKERQQFEKDKKNFLFRQNTFIKVKRFAIRNKHPIMGTAIGVLFIIFVVVSTSRSVGRRPTTAGMASDTVIMAYYEAFSSLDHIFMEACIQGADKTDINVAVNFFAVSRTRQAYELSASSPIIPARIWRESGGELPARDVFGVTDLSIEHLAGDERDGMIIYRASYILWSPEMYSIRRSDILTLRQDRKKNWRITEIIRTES